MGVEDPGIIGFFVPIDTTSVFSNKLYGRLNEFVFNYVDNHRKGLDKWELKDFIANFDKSNKVISSYLNFIDIKMPISPKSKENLKVYLKALIARNLFGETGYFMATQNNDNMIQKVLELDSKN